MDSVITVLKPSVSRISPNEVGRVCLIIPPSAFLLDERVFMSLGILRVAAVLKAAKHDVWCMDLSGVSNFSEVVSDYTESSDRANYFGITATTPQMPAVTEIVSVLRQKHPTAKIILGGPHITLVNAAYKNEVRLGVSRRATSAMRQMEQMFDVLVAGDGEEAVFHALEKNAKKLVDADDKTSPLFLDNARLDALPFPERELVDVESYHYSIDGVRALSLIAQLGCPFGCGFCGGRASPMLRRIRTRSSQNVVDEMVHLYERYGIKGFMLYDDELNVNKKMVELMNLITETQERLGTKWCLRGFIKAELFDEVQAKAMYSAGFRWILTGFESGSPRILTNINKIATREDNTRCVEIAHQAGLKVKALMSIGHPGETRETVLQTQEWLLEVMADDFDVTIITCYPGTPYYDEAVPHPTKEGLWVYTYKKTGDVLYQVDTDHTKVADYYKGNPDGGYRSFVFTPDISPEELVSMRDAVEREVRQKLGIPFNAGVPAMLYEHSMGQQGQQLPKNILRN